MNKNIKKEYNIRKLKINICIALKLLYILYTKLKFTLESKCEVKSELLLKILKVPYYFNMETAF